jgi:phosphoribosylamine--glycine ligase
MKVLIIGGGGREHALAAKLCASSQVSEVLCAPGNGGTAAIARNLELDAEDPAAVVAAARAHGVELVVVGPEAPLVAGVVDALSAAGIAAFGPPRQAAQLEGSKAFSKEFMARHGIATAGFAVFDDADAADAYVRERGQPLVVKADGLAAGKGVVVASDVPETLDAIDRMLRKREFGSAGARVVLEERLRGQEVSYHVITDGERYVPLAAAQDHKAVGEGDSGPNTGGMGAYSPPPVVTAEVEHKILTQVVERTLAGFRADGIVHRGALFIGLMIVDGEPQVLEYNVRFGDPETQVLMARYGGDVLPLLLGSARGDLRGVEPRWEAPSAMTVVLAAPGYPGSYQKNLEIRGLDVAARHPGIEISHAGTRREGDRVFTTGGRVLSVTGRGPDLDTVAAQVYAAVADIHFDGMHYRRDIGWRARRAGT